MLAVGYTFVSLVASIITAQQPGIWGQDLMLRSTFMEGRGVASELVGAVQSSRVALMIVAAAVCSPNRHSAPAAAL